MDLSYPQFFQPQGDENQTMQSLFGESQPQAQQQFYVFPPPSGGSLDSGYAGEDTNPFDENAYCQDFKINFAQNNEMSNVDTMAVRFASYNFNANDQQAVALEQNFMPINFSTSFQQDFTLTNQRTNVSRSPPALVMDDTVSVKSEDASSEGVSPRETGFQDKHSQGQCQQTRKRRPSTLKRMATDTSTETRRTSDERVITKEGRGRQRKRIPHTAVERRYRENLNLHLEKLRSAVPNLQAAHRRRSSDINDPMKPSKCEVLMGAVDYIKRLEREVERMKNEMGE